MTTFLPHTPDDIRAFAESLSQSAKTLCQVAEAMADRKVQQIGVRCSKGYEGRVWVQKFTAAVQYSYARSLISSANGPMCNAKGRRVKKVTRMGRPSG